MTNNNQLCEAILGLMRVSMFGEVAGEDIVSGLESSKSLWCQHRLKIPHFIG